MQWNMCLLTIDCLSEWNNIWEFDKNWYCNEIWNVEMEAERSYWNDGFVIMKYFNVVYQVCNGDGMNEW